MKSSVVTSYLSTLFAVGLLSTQAAYAADVTAPEAEAPATYPYVEGVLELELGDDWVFSSDDPTAEINDLYFSGALGLTVGLTPMLALNLGLTAESVLDPAPSTDRTFGDIGLYVDTLNLEASLGMLTLTAGKFGPSFGSAWDITPGVYGTSFAEDYELSEMIGFGAAVEFETGAAGTITVGGNVFFADTTVLSDSAFTSRGRTSLADGGLANTESLDNFSLTIDGTDIAAMPGFSYNLGYRHLSAGVTETADEDGFAAGLAKETELANGDVIVVNGEVAYFSNYGGVSDDDAVYLTAGLAYVHGPWHGEVAGSLRLIDYSGGGSDDDQLFQVSAGYEFENGIDVSAGYTNARVAGDTSHTLGLRLTKAFEFSTR